LFYVKCEFQESSASCKHIQILTLNIIINDQITKLAIWWNVSEVHKSRYMSSA